jgi:hypothetical protein
VVGGDSAAGKRWTGFSPTCRGGNLKKWSLLKSIFSPKWILKDGVPIHDAPIYGRQSQMEIGKDASITKSSLNDVDNKSRKKKRGRLHSNSAWIKGFGPVA